MSDPLDLWKAVRSCAAPGAAVLVMDLFRPASRQEARSIVETYAGGDPEIFKTDFLNSLLGVIPSGRGRATSWRRPASAALRVDVVSDRHLMVFGRVEASG